MSEPVRTSANPVLRRCRRFLDEYSGMVLLSLAAATVVAGGIGGVINQFPSALSGQSPIDGVAQNSISNSGSIDTSKPSALVGGKTPPSFFNAITDILYELGQILSLNMDPHSEDFNIWIGIARILAVAFVTILGIEVIRRLFRQSLEHLRIAWHKLFGRSIVLVIGTGTIASHVARSHNLSKKLVIMLNVNSARNDDLAIRDEGIIVRHLNVADPMTLESFATSSTKEIYVATGNDRRTLEILTLLDKQKYAIKSGNSKRKNCRCYVHIESNTFYHRLCRTNAEQRQASAVLSQTKNTTSSMEIHYFNIYHETACDLIINELTSQRPQVHERALYIIHGFGRMGQAMVKELVEYAHFENRLRPRILVIAANAKSAQKKCAAEWPRMTAPYVHDSLSQVKFDANHDHWHDRGSNLPTPYHTNSDKAVDYAANVHFCSLQQPEKLTQEEVAAIRRLADEANLKTVVLFCGNNDERNYEVAVDFNHKLADFHGFNLMSARQIPSFVFLPRSASLRAQLDQQMTGRSMQSFGSVDRGIQRAHDSMVEELGMVVAWAYDRLMLRKKEASDLSALEKSIVEKDDFDHKEYQLRWNGLRYWEKYSNCAAAEHAWVKLQFLGILPEQVLAGDAAVLERLNRVSLEERSLLALVEHNRWMAERLLLGWAYGVRSDHPPCRPSITAHKDLDEEEREKDLAQIKAICKYFQSRI